MKKRGFPEANGRDRSRRLFALSAFAAASMVRSIVDVLLSSLVTTLPELDWRSQGGLRQWGRIGEVHAGDSTARMVRRI